MPSILGFEFSLRPKRRPEPAEQSFSVVRRGQQGEAPANPRLSTATATTATGWSLSPTSVGHPGSPVSPARPGSPENPQQAYFGGEASISPTSPTGHRRLFVTNPDPDMVVEHPPTPTPGEAQVRHPVPAALPAPRETQERPQLASLIIPSRADLGPYPDNLVPRHGTGAEDLLPPAFDSGSARRPASRHPDILTPGRGTPPRTQLTPDLTFEQPGRRTPRYQTFEDMGFLRVKRIRSLWNPFTWGSNKSRIMYIDKIDPRKYVVIPSTPAIPALPASHMPIGDLPPLPARLPNPFPPAPAPMPPNLFLHTPVARPANRAVGRAINPAADLAEARRNLMANPQLRQRVPEPTLDPAWIGRNLERPSAPTPDHPRNLDMERPSRPPLEHPRNQIPE